MGKFTFSKILDVSNGFASVMGKDSKMTYVRLGDGHVITGEWFDICHPFTSLGLAIVERDGKKALIDTYGVFAVGWCEHITGVSSVLLSDVDIRYFLIKTEDGYNYYTRNGLGSVKWFDEALIFGNDNVAIVKSDGKKALLDFTTGKIVSYWYDELKAYQLNRYYIATNGTESVVVDSTGRIRSYSFEYHKQLTTCGYIALPVKKDKGAYTILLYNLVSLESQEVIGTYERIESINDFIFVMDENCKVRLFHSEHGFITDWCDDITHYGKQGLDVVADGLHNTIDMVTCQFVSPVWSEERIELSEDGLIRVKKDGLYNFLSDGKYLSDIWFNWTGDFHDGHCIVKIKTKYNVIDRSGKLLIPK